MRYILFLVSLFFVGSGSFAQVHSELTHLFELQQEYEKGLLDSTLEKTTHLQKKAGWSIQTGTQWINGPQQGRNNLYFNNKPGLHTYFTGIGRLKWKGVQLHVQPMLIRSQINEIQDQRYVFPKEWWIVWWSNRVKWTNRIDDRSIALTNDELRFLPGNTYFSVDAGKIRFYSGYRQKHWGPSAVDGMILSRNAPSFLQAGISSNEIGAKVGNGFLKWDLMLGSLPSPTYQYDDNGYKVGGRSIIVPKNGLQRLVNGFDLNYTTGGTNPFQFGLNHLSMLYPSVDRRLHRMLPLLNYPFSLKTPEPNEPASMGSMYVRWKVPNERLTVWAEYGYGDRAISPLSPFLRDTALSGYTVGVSKIKPLRQKRFIELFAQVGYLQANTIQQARNAYSWYTHGEVRQGFTHQGNVLGNGIGPGGTSAYVAVSLMAPSLSYGFFVERKMNNKDFFYSNFRYEEFARQWMDLRAGLWLAFQHKQVRHHINFTWMKSFCYQWQVKPNPAGFYQDYAVDQFGFRLSYEVRLGDL